LIEKEKEKYRRNAHDSLFVVGTMTIVLMISKNQN
jgi:hypothetical protein